MGYYTHFTLTTIPAEANDNGRMEEGIEQYLGWMPFGESTKWYDCIEDMVKISREFPDVVFIIDGEGESQGDKWRAFFKDGAFHKATQPEWTPPDYDPSLLR